jgi:glycosyltransferase involved in cell wall biosynthesis
VARNRDGIARQIGRALRYRAPVRIAVLHPSFSEMGGAEVLARAQAIELARLGHHVRIVSFSLGRLAGSVGDAVELVELRRPLRRPEAPRAFFEAISGVERALRVVLGDVERVIAHHPPASELAARVGLAARTVFYCHEPPRSLHRTAVSPRLEAFSRSPAAGESLAVAGYLRALRLDARRERVPFGIATFRREERRAVQALHAVWANSEFTRSLVETVYGRADADVVPPFVAAAVSDVDEVTTRARGQGEPLRLLLRSRLQPMKNVDAVLRAVKLGLERGLRLELDVVGEGTSRSALERLSRALEIADHVRFHGFLPAADSERVSRNAHAFVLLPFDEPFGMVFVEAALAGLSVLGPDSGGAPEILRHGGFLARPEEPQAIADAIAAIDRATSVELAERNARLKRHCVEHYTRQAFARRAEALLAKRT